MTISNAAKAHHDQLFGDRVSTLAQTDPEFAAYFDNFAFDEILGDAADLDASVDLHTRLLVQLAAAGVELPLPGQATSTPETRHTLSAINDLTT